MKLAYGAATLALLLCTVSCDSSGIWHEPIPSEGFLFRVSVADPSGNPVDGLRVSTINHLSSTVAARSGEHAMVLSHPATTAFPCILATACTVDFTVYDLNGRRVTTVIHTPMDAGHQTIVWSTSADEIPQGIYHCRLRATSLDSDSVLFWAGTYAVLHYVHPEYAALGYTSVGGTFETHDSLLFPGVLKHLPALIRTSDANDKLGTFSFVDSVTIILTDTVNSAQMTFERKIVRTANSFHLTWQPPARSTPRIEPSGPPVRAGRLAGKTSALSATWQLGQNYPNPFN